MTSEAQKVFCDAEEQVEQGVRVAAGEEEEAAGDDDEQVEHGVAADGLEACAPVSPLGPRVGEEVGRDQRDDDQVRECGESGCDQPQASREVLGIGQVETGG
jgi:hypothetical protein